MAAGEAQAATCRPAVLCISLDAQIARGDSTGTAGGFGDPVERQRCYAAGLAALHVVAKTGRDVRAERVALAPNAWAYPTRSRSRYAFVADAYRIGAHLCRAGPVDVVSAQDPFGTGLVAYALARRFGKSLNVQVHFDVLDDPHWLRERAEHRLLNALGKWLVRRADTVRVGTTRERDKLVRRGVAPERIYVAPVPVDVERFAAAKPDPRLRERLGGGDALVLAAGRLVPQKDVATLLRAAAIVAEARPATRFAIAGDGPLGPDLARLARELGLEEQVRFVGPIAHAGMPAALATADVLAVSSAYEGTSLITVEAAAAGTPVVTTDVAGAADTVVDGQTGRVVPIGDAPTFARALLDVLADPARRRAMGLAARAHVRRRFALDQAVETVVTMWSDTAALRARSRERWLYLANARIPSEKAHVYQIAQMVDALRAAGIDVELAYPSRANVAGVGGQDPVRLYGLRARPPLRPLFSLDAVRLVTLDVPALNRPPLPAAAFGLQTATFAAAAALYARRCGAGVVYSRDWPVLWAAGAAAPRLPAFWEAHDVPEGRLARAALRRLLPRLRGVVAISGGVRDALVRLGAPAERILVASDAVDLARFDGAPSRAAARAALRLPAEAPVVVYTGQLFPWKGARTLALASRHLPGDALVCIVGGAPADLASFRAFVRERRLDNVRVAGYVPPCEVPVWLAAADVLALPNSGRETISSRYTSPLKLYEYMAASRPIVASDLPSLRETLRHGANAYLVPPDDPAQLAAGLATVLGDRALAGRLAGEARRNVEGHTWDARARRIVEFVRRRS